MGLVFQCTKCESVLSPNVRVILVARRGKEQGLMLLSPRLGDYSFQCDEKLNGAIDDGDAVEFLCPVCHESLNSPDAEGFAELMAIDKTDTNLEPKIVRFSCVCKEHATFVYDKDSVKKFGVDAERHYKNMRIEGPWGW